MMSSFPVCARASRWMDPISMHACTFDAMRVATRRRAVRCTSRIPRSLRSSPPFRPPDEERCALSLCPGEIAKL
jgi:hypothetical protein